MRNRFVRFVLVLGAKLMTWAFVQMGKRDGLDPVAVRHIVMREENAIWDTVRGALLWRKTEADILSARLGRRYDLGMALNEAANRAIEAKRAAREEADPTGGLTSKQLAALEIQKQYLKRVVDRS